METNIIIGPLTTPAYKYSTLVPTISQSSTKIMPDPNNNPTPTSSCASMDSDADTLVALLEFVAELQRAINELVTALDVQLPALDDSVDDPS